MIRTGKWSEELFVQISGSFYYSVMICRQSLARLLSMTCGHSPHLPAPLSNIEDKFQAETSCFVQVSSVSIRGRPLRYLTCDSCQLELYA